MKASSAGALLLTLVLAGCGSPPTHFFTLFAQGPAQPVGASACGGPPIAVQHIMLPGVLDRQSIVRLRDSDVVVVSGVNRWAAPLGDVIARGVAQDLRLRLSPSQVLLPGDVAPNGGPQRLTLNIARFIADPAGQVTLQVDWSLTSLSGSVLTEQTETITTRAETAKIDGVVAAMSQALSQLSDRIATALQTCAFRK
jgi:uncharacterized lipoprotein YmbA